MNKDVVRNSVRSFFCDDNIDVSNLCPRVSYSFNDFTNTYH